MMIQIDNIWAERNEICPNGVIFIEWSGDTGYGRYELVIESDPKVVEAGNDAIRIFGYSECMDSNENKQFLKELLSQLINHIDIKE